MRNLLPILPLLFPFVAVAEEASPRRTTSLNGEWRFQQEPSSGGCQSPEASTAGLRPPLAGEWKPVRVPQAWEHHEGMAFDGIGWYRKELSPIDLKPGRRLLLHFDAVATHATVYWNGTKLGEHLGPWTPFRFDVTEEIRKAPKGKHVIDVRVDEKVGHNTQGFLPIIQPHFGGIWQEVKLIEVPERYIDDLTWSARVENGEARISARVADQTITRTFPLLPTWSPTTPRVQRHKLIEGEDEIEVQAAFRTIETKGDQFLLNGQPLIIRGVLNWGYYPPSLAPNPDPEVWRQDLRLIKSWGFNLMKCCLWVPPQRFLEIADEEGVLLWIEYPTWHPKLDQRHRADLVREYTEFFHHDRNHPSVILRSLTCETGHQADLAIIQELYDLGKKLIPGSLIVDDSSWIEWNRVYDFFDDHPYGNNHTWVPTLQRLKDYIAKKGTKPLVLGEAIAADTWVKVPPPSPRRAIPQRKLGGVVEAPSNPPANADGSATNAGSPFQPIFLEANRAWLARMEQVIGGPIDQDRLRADSLRYAWLMRKYQIETFRHEVPNGGYVVSVLRDFPLASMGLIDYEGKPKWEAKDWAWHGEKKRDDDPWPKADSAKVPTLPASADIKTVRQLDEKLLEELAAGGKVLLLPNGQRGSLPLKSHWFLRGGPFINTHHPLIKNTQGLHELLVDHQHFDFAGDVIPDVQYLEEIDPILLLWDNHDIPQVKTHGLVFETRVGKGRLFVSALNHEKKAGRALLDVFLHHLDQGPPPRNGLKPETIAGMKAKLREKKLDLAGSTPLPNPPPQGGREPEWKFKPDAKGDATWAMAVVDATWKPIKLGQHWEGQGYPTLDGWAWYRLDLTLPADWQGQPIYWHCDGLDDHAEFYVNGQRVGTMGDLANKKTAFEDKASFEITQHARPGDTVKLAVRVHDWYGAGGCHRPQWLSTVPRTSGQEILK